MGLVRHRGMGQEDRTNQVSDAELAEMEQRMAHMLALVKLLRIMAGLCTAAWAVMVVLLLLGYR